MRKERVTKSLGYNLVSVWECDRLLQELKYNTYSQSIYDNLKKKFIPYPDFICYDFEAILQKDFQQITDDLSFNQTHIPVSVAIIDTCEKEPTFIINSNADDLVKEFVENLEKRRKKIVEKVKKEYPLPDQDSIPNKVLEEYEEWCNQVPVLGFNSGKYDINMIKIHFVKIMTDKTKEIFVARNANKYMFLTTPHFKFLDVMSYLAPGLSFDKWCKANKCEAKKLVFPYEWLDSYDKLSHVGTVKHEDFYSSLKKENITVEEYEDFKREFEKRGCVTMMDWLREYNLHELYPLEKL